MTINVALVGYGIGGATFHAPLIGATDELRLTSIVTRDPERRAAAARRYPSVHLVADVDALFASAPLPDLVVVSSPSGTHAALARRSLEAGCHVVVDKPFAASVREAREIDVLARAAGRLAIPFQNRRWDGDFLTVRQLVEQNALGAIHRFESRFERWRERPRPRWCEPNAREAAEGIVFDIGSHLLDQALHLLGPARSVYAELARVRPEVTVEDDAFISLVHENGVRSHLYMSASSGAPGARFTLSGARGAYVKHGLDGQEASLRDGADPRSAGWSAASPSEWGTITLDGASAPRPTLDGEYGSFYPAVAAAIARGSAPPVPLADAIATLQVIEAAFRSAAEGAVVRMEPERAR